ncbi:hypothetical protein LIER_14376 [Lithospermum erythrorhizon]|uniref:Reverse transcriptase n=1 Tax=Lithospermum erythrorhizon TaxID=34254 RepID=A0AAV3Q165_LITER
MQWYKEGDASTSFFHKSMRMHHSQHRIVSMRDKDGVLVTDFEQVKGIIVDFYKNLFAAPQVDTCIEVEINNLELEIEVSMLSMKKGKAPGPDGFISEFYKDSREVVKGTVVEAIQTFFATGYMPRHLNSTIISLIRKVANPENMKDFRPISC